MQAVTLNQEQANARLIKPKEMVSCEVAFIDCKLPGSQPKKNYSLIGPGVTQSAEQVINIPEAHGFNIGAAAMKNGITNNLHIHFTVEVFFVYSGKWIFRWGAKGENEVLVEDPQTIVSVPTWIFRGFTNVSDEGQEGWLFTSLGGNDTGGIIWHPSILEKAAPHGLFLSKDNMLIDTNKGDAKPSDDQLMPTVSETFMDSLQKYTVEEMMANVVTPEKRVWSSNAFLDSCLDGHGAQVAPVIGFGMSQDRLSKAPIIRPHGFSIEWVKVNKNGKVGTHLCDQVQVIKVFSGTLEVSFNRGQELVTVVVDDQSVISIPANTWRSYRCLSNETVFTVTSAGDQRKRIYWDQAIVDAAFQKGWAVDPDGYIAPANVLPMTALEASKNNAIFA